MEEGDNMELSVDIQKILPDFTLDVSLATKEGVIGLLGASGSGKSMTLLCIAGIMTPTQGRIALNGTVFFDSTKGINVPPRERNIGFIFQNYALFPHLTVAQNIAFGLKGRPKKEGNAKVEEMIDQVKLDGLERRYPYQLSGGQQQRVALARALATEPEALLLDEPFSALDSHLRGQMENLLVETLAGYNRPTVFVTHHLDESYRLCRELLLLEEGKVTARGEKKAVFESPPTYNAARITGCKNLSRIRPLSEGMVEALEWECELKVKRHIPAEPAYAGIRSHHLEIVPEVKGAGLNTFPAWLSRFAESPQYVTLFLHLHRPSPLSGAYHLEAEISLEKWQALKECPFPWMVSLNPDRLFLTV
jgi:molybdate transport system permease protein